MFCIIIVNIFHNIAVKFLFCPDQRFDPSFKCKRNSENEDNNFRQMLTAAEIRYRRWRRDEYLYKKRRQRNYRYGSCR